MTIPALKTVFDGIVKAVAADNSLDAWANINFGNGHHVFADISSEDPPTADDDSPFIIIAMPGRSADQDRRIIEDRFNVFCCFTKNALKTIANENLEIPSGLYLMLEMEDYIDKAIKGAMPENYTMAYDMDTDNIGVLPEIHAEFAVRLTLPIVLDGTSII